MESNYKELNKKLNALVAEFGKENTGILKGFMQMHHTINDEGALNPKTKELMALAIGVVIRCDGCIASHTQRALECGASHTEITETLGVAVYMGGGPALVYASMAMKALSDFEK